MFFYTIAHINSVAKDALVPPSMAIFITFAITQDFISTDQHPEQFLTIGERQSFQVISIKPHDVKYTIGELRAYFGESGSSPLLVVA